MNDYKFDLFRIFFGEKPPLFLLEVAVRTLVIVSYTLVLLRWMGKRGMGQLTPFELAIIVGLGSAVGDPMFYDDVPLIHTMLVIALIIGLQHFLSWITEKNKTIEFWVEGPPTGLRPMRRRKAGPINFRLKLSRAVQAIL